MVFRFLIFLFGVFIFFILLEFDRGFGDWWGRGDSRLVLGELVIRVFGLFLEFLRSIELGGNLNRFIMVFIGDLIWVRVWFEIDKFEVFLDIVSEIIGGIDVDGMELIGVFGGSGVFGIWIVNLIGLVDWFGIYILCKVLSRVMRLCMVFVRFLVVILNFFKLIVFLCFWL